MKILLTGASGFVGSAITQALEKQDHIILPISRHHGYDFKTLTDSKSWLPLLQGVDAVINCVGILGETRQQSFQTLHIDAPSTLFKACEQLNVQRVIQISALGADINAQSPYHFSKFQADNSLRTTSLNWFILKPSLVYGTHSPSTKLFKALARLPIVGVIDKGQQIVQPVLLDDLVATVIMALAATPTQQTINVVGNTPFSFVEWLKLLRKKQGIHSPLRIFSIPLSIALAASVIGKYFSPLVHPDTINMLMRGNNADTTPLIQFLGRNLTAWEEIV